MSDNNEAGEIIKQQFAASEIFEKIREDVKNYGINYNSTIQTNREYESKSYPALIKEYERNKATLSDT